MAAQYPNEKGTVVLLSAEMRAVLDAMRGTGPHSEMAEAVRAGLVEAGVEGVPDTINGHCFRLEVGTNKETSEQVELSVSVAPDRSFMHPETYVFGGDRTDGWDGNHDINDYTEEMPKNIADIKAEIEKLRAKYNYAAPGPSDRAETPARDSGDNNLPPLECDRCDPRFNFLVDNSLRLVHANIADIKAEIEKLRAKYDYAAPGPSDRAETPAQDSNDDDDIPPLACSRCELECSECTCDANTGTTEPGCVLA